jgi:cytoplasmic iron level regulating protein YaaA (DUF328/UPF0246 family)
MKLFCIHGNFQTAKVWQSLQERMKAEFSDLDMITEDLYAKPFQSFDDWTEDFCAEGKSKRMERNPFCLDIHWVAD